MDDKKAIKVFNITSTNLVQYLLGKKSKYRNYIAYFAMFAAIFTINIVNAQTTLQEINDCSNIYIHLTDNSWTVVKNEGQNSLNGFNYYTVIQDGYIAIIASKLMYSESVFNLINEGSINPCFNVYYKPVRTLRFMQEWCVGFYEGKKILIQTMYRNISYSIE
jgi:hypothetical protein